MWSRIARRWLPIAVACTCVIGFTYLTGQQVYRNTADEPQLQIASHAAAELDRGVSPHDLVPTQTVDIVRDTSAFIVIFGQDDSPLEGSGVIGVSMVNPPAGVLQAARKRGKNRVTWQPGKGIRVATVAAATRDGRVVFAGRSLATAEKAVDDLGRLALIAWAATLAAVLLGCALAEMTPRTE